jgi:hypothetical protein
VTAPVSFVVATIAVPIMIYDWRRTCAVRASTCCRAGARDGHYFGTAPLPRLPGGAVDGVGRRA